MGDWQWILDAIHPFEYDVASLVPPVFPAYARVFHPAYEIDMPEPRFPVSWHAVARANNRIAHPAMEWASLVGSFGIHSQEGIWDRQPDTGRLPAPTAQALSRVLKRHWQPEGVSYALWNGYGGIQLSSAALIELPDRPMWVTAGSIDNAAEPFGIPGRTANAWWPGDRRWYVATDIDLMTTYVGATAACIEEIVNSAALEAFPVASDQRVTWDADTLNPLPDPPRPWLD